MLVTYPEAPPDKQINSSVTATLDSVATWAPPPSACAQHRRHHVTPPALLRPEAPLQPETEETPRNLQLETLRDDRLQGHGPLARVGIAAGRQPVGEHEVPGLGHDGLGVELDALEGQGAVAHAHDDA